MADWTMVGRDVADIFRSMAHDELHGISPSYEALCLAVADDPGLCEWLLSLPPAKRQPNLLLAATRYLDGPVGRPVVFPGWVRENLDAVTEVILTRRTQTNEARRCATLLPLLASLPGPLALVEVGASAGLCLLPDRYSYRFTTSAGVVTLGTGHPELPCELADGITAPTQMPDVVWRRGLDLNPLDVTDPDQMRWLRCLIWPEQTDRLTRLDEAVATARLDRPRVDTGNLLSDLEPLLDEMPADATPVVFHTAVLAYLGPQDRATFESTMHRLNSERGVQWISNESAGVIAGTDDAPAGVARGAFVLARNGRPVARTGPHGHFVRPL